MHAALAVSLISLLATCPSYTAAIPILTNRGTCNATPGPADRRGASAVAQMLIDQANEATDRESGGLLIAKPEYTTVAEYGWQDGDGVSHKTFVQIRILPSATTSQQQQLNGVEIPRRNVYGTVMDLIFGCADHECSSDSCPVGGETVPPSDPIIQVRLSGNTTST